MAEEITRREFIKRVATTGGVLAAAIAGVSCKPGTETTISTGGTEKFITPDGPTGKQKRGDVTVENRLPNKALVIDPWSLGVVTMALPSFPENDVTIVVGGNAKKEGLALPWTINIDSRICSDKELANLNANVLYLFFLMGELEKRGILNMPSGIEQIVMAKQAAGLVCALIAKNEFFQQHPEVNFVGNPEALEITEKRAEEIWKQSAEGNKIRITNPPGSGQGNFIAMPPEEGFYASGMVEITGNVYNLPIRIETVAYQG